MVALDNIESVHNTAIAAAQRAEADFRAKHGEPGYCGFAWVHVSEKASTKLAVRSKKLVSVRATKVAWICGTQAVQAPRAWTSKKQVLKPMLTSCAVLASMHT